MTVPVACATTVRFSRSLFTGKERDAESGNDYFGARYYASSMGRFLSPDWSAKEDPVPYAQLADPQSLNLYSYVRNNPMDRVDPNGHWTCTGDNAKGSACQAMAAIHANEGLVVKGVDQLAVSAAVNEAARNTADANSHASFFQAKYQATSDGNRRGASFILLGKYTGTVNYADYNFIQNVTTDTPTEGNPTNTPYHDYLPGAVYPFYYPPNMQKSREKDGEKAGGVTVFEDNPGRPFQGKRISWHAELSLVGIKSNGTYDTLRTVNWGFTVNAKGNGAVDPNPIQESQ
jgi:RHS repeat-associated protein